ncbi:MAG: sigma 54-interacting transcriptional regulator [candidate division Zixibacteria bacterium]|jgi:DNA-binding NtrC family response regulator|nr:sigma 54-interacting transcriptional regulator [candidate division Zixibacteria bacterium]
MKRFDEVQRLIDSKDFSEALQLLKSQGVPNPDSPLLNLYIVMESELLLHSGECQNLRIDEAIEALRFGDQSEMFARAKYVKGWQLAMQSDFLAAREQLVESYAGYLRLNSKSKAASALNLLAFVETHVGNQSTALLNLDRASQLHIEAGSRDKSMNAKANKAHLLCRIGRFAEARELYGELEAMILDVGERGVTNFFINASLSECLVGEYDRARGYLDEVSESLMSHPREHAVALEVKGKLETLRGNLTKAEKHLSEGLKLSLQIAPESTLVSQTKRLLADVYVAMKDYDRARTVAEEALAVATKINERLEIAACHRVFGQVDAYRGEYESAREWFRKAIDMLAMIGAQYELAVTRFCAVESGIYTSTESIAHLTLAKEYFAREQVKPYLDKTDRALHTLTSHRAKPATADREAPIVVSQSRAMQTILEKIEYVAPSNMNVLLLGETGTGKDLIARWIHHVSGRTGEFVSVNAAAIPDNMFEAELFGYKRGAYTGAESDRAGLIELAAGGTFYLNEIADTTPAVQAKLLEVIENKRLRRLGENNERAVDFRLIAASNIDIVALVQQNKFRADLYHRLNEIPIALPALRTRPEDILPLIGHFLRLNGADGDLVRCRHDIARLAKVLSSRIWPGNVRELQAEVRRLWVESRGSIDRMAHMLDRDRSDIERRELLELLDTCGGNRREMARRLNVSDSTIRYRLRKFGIDTAEQVPASF